MAVYSLFVLILQNSYKTFKNRLNADCALRRFRILKSINVPLKKRFQGIYSILCIRTGCRKRNNGAGYNTHRHNTQKALCIHLAVSGFQPNTALEFVGLLHEVCSLLVVQTGLATNHDFLVEHVYTLLLDVIIQWVRLRLDI